MLALSDFSSDPRASNSSSRLPVVAAVVPLEEDVHRDGDPAGLLDDDARDEAPREQPEGRDARLDHSHADTDGDQAAGEPDGPGHFRERQQLVERRLPLGDRHLDQRQDQPVDDVVARPFTGHDCLAQLGARLLHAVRDRAIAAPGQLDRRSGEPLGGRLESPRHETRVHGAHPARVSHQDQRDGVGGGRSCRRPQGAGDLVDGEFALGDSTGEELF